MKQRRLEIWCKCLRCCKMFPSKFTFTLHLQRKHLKRRRLMVNYKKEAFDDAILSENELQQNVKPEEIFHSELDIKTESNEDDIVKSYLDTLNSSVCKKEMEEVNLKEINYFNTRTICKLCKKNLSKKILKRHILLCHSSPSSQNQNLFTCTICAKAFKNKSLLTHHNKNIHLQKFKIICKICKKQFSRHDILRRPVQIVHLKDIKITCMICNKKFKHKCCLKEHMENVHSNSSKMTCEICHEQIWKKSLMLTPGHCNVSCNVIPGHLDVEETPCECRPKSMVPLRFVGNMPKTKVLAAGAAFVVAYLLMETKETESEPHPHRWKTNLYKKANGPELMLDLRDQQISGQYKNFTWMTPSDFEYLLTSTGPKITKINTVMREAISIQDRLAVTLRFLATGDSYTSLQYLFRISKQSISLIVPEVCSAIIELLKENIRIPSTQTEWRNISKQFEELWKIPHCLGSMDGKHVIVQARIKSGTKFRNHKSSFSIVMFALVDAQHNFVSVDARCRGRFSDGYIFKDAKLFQKLEARKLNLPAPEPLQGRKEEVPYVFIADSAFILTENIMTPYPEDNPIELRERIFNYRLSKACRIVENVFGITASVFRVLRKPMLLQPENAETIIMAIAHLHNFLRRNVSSQNIYTPPGSLDCEVNGRVVKGSWRNDVGTTSLLPIANVPSRDASTPKDILREEFTDYFLNEGNVLWQD